LVKSEVVMKIGVFLLASEQSADPAVVARRAEELGFASFWVPEHPILPVHYSSRYPGSPDGSIPAAVGIIADPFVALARASAATSAIQLGTGVCLVPERNPLLLAKEIATLDHYSGGRFLFGIGAGWLKEETEIMGGDFAHRWTQTRDAILAMKELWTKDESEYHGRYYNFPAVRSFPKPARAGREGRARPALPEYNCFRPAGTIHQQARHSGPGGSWHLACDYLAQTHEAE
jgi:alkanesulfonate monooxygenase SsuD/methylene tetrahydromethanopterin reductase-like flavin-dependent oxidoreductase (luciferase family)